MMWTRTDYTRNDCTFYFGTLEETDCACYLETFWMRTKSFGSYYGVNNLLLFIDNEAILGMVFEE